MAREEYSSPSANKAHSLDRDRAYPDPGFSARAWKSSHTRLRRTMQKWSLKERSALARSARPRMGAGQGQSASEMARSSSSVG